MSHLKVLKEYYYNPKTGFCTAKTLAKRLKEAGYNIPMKEVSLFVDDQLAQQVHRKVVKKGETLKFRPSYINEMWSIDLAVMGKYSYRGYKYIFVGVDAFSKKAYARALKEKTEKACLESLVRMISMYDKPVSIISDNDKAFIGKKFQKYLEENGIAHKKVNAHSHSNMLAESFIRTLKRKLFKTMTGLKTDNWVKHVDDAVENYMDSEHTFHGRKPKDVNHDGDELAINIKKIMKREPKGKAKFEKGDNVRVSKLKEEFKVKGYTKNWSDEIFVVGRVFAGKPVTYGLKDTEGKTIVGRFYANELQKVIAIEEVDTYVPEKIVKHRKRKGKLEYLVKWKGYDELTWEKPGVLRGEQKRKRSELELKYFGT